MTTPAFDTAVVQPVVADFIAVQVLLPFYSLRLLDGVSQVRFDPVSGQAARPGSGESELFYGTDPQFGSLGALDAVTEGLGTAAPSLRMTVRPPTRTAAAQLNLPGNQGSEMRMWYGALNLDTGVVIGTTELFWGELNQPRYATGKAAMAVEFDVASALEALFNNEEGLRLNHATQISAFPDDDGCEYVVDVERKLPWGSVADRPPLVSAAGGGYAPQYAGPSSATVQAALAATLFGKGLV